MHIVTVFLIENARAGLVIHVLHNCAHVCVCCVCACVCVVCVHVCVCMIIVFDELQTL